MEALRRERDPPKVTSGLDCSYSSDLAPTQGSFPCLPVAELRVQERSHSPPGGDGGEVGSGWRAAEAQQRAQAHPGVEHRPWVGESHLCAEVAILYH